MKTAINRIFLYAALFVLALLIASCQSNIPAETPRPVPTVTISIETLRASPNYMAGCEKINLNSTKMQAGYKDIYPGYTTKDEVEDLLGKPIRTNEINSTTWEYDNLAVTFDGLIVNELFVAGDSVTGLKDMILKYGCPDAIYALDINEEHRGEYSRLLFIYPGIGFDFTVDIIPADLNGRINDMSYFKPGTLAYYSDLIHTLDITDTSKLMTWDEAVQ